MEHHESPERKWESEPHRQGFRLIDEGLHLLKHLHRFAYAEVCGLDIAILEARTSAIQPLEHLQYFLVLRLSYRDAGYRCLEHLIRPVDACKGVFNCSGGVMGTLKLVGSIGP